MDLILIIFVIAVLIFGLRAIRATIAAAAGLFVLGLTMSLFALAMKIPVFYFTLAVLLIAIPALLIPPPHSRR